MSKSLENRNAIVTGASRGIGSAIAYALAANGANVVITYSASAGKAEDLAKKIIADFGVKAYAIKSDASQYDSAEKLVAEVSKLFKTVDILVNNAGVDDDCLIQDLDAERFHKLLQVNTVYPVLLVKHCIPYFGTKPRVINTSSVLARQVSEYGCTYSASKAALESVTKTIAVELGQKHSLTCNALSVGTTATDMWYKSEPAVLEAYEATIKATPAASRIGEPEDIADIAVFLAGESSRWVTGSTICANGGMQFI
ncbi:unnamed protein product [Kuraishia capsulata CBS 1993]|uniref:3-oxoacyl-[acyl-carrier-protein] reductase n=1 Tax=Kuraishia capsulata CBS 1993 TaxID=1382522 RepID=W6MF07_9ASCO|nr:uncharacterized protein KUCA_T00000019001 [Kuraishia capsulata CBS 1993]CDK24059.1 unnamed protein product [Kuraishia capsulata CBS 1993]